MPGPLSKETLRLPSWSTTGLTGLDGIKYKGNKQEVNSK